MHDAGENGVGRHHEQRQRRHLLHVHFVNKEGHVVDAGIHPNYEFWKVKEHLAAKLGMRAIKIHTHPDYFEAGCFPVRLGDMDPVGKVMRDGDVFIVESDHRIGIGRRRIGKEVRPMIVFTSSPLYNNLAVLVGVPRRRGRKTTYANAARKSPTRPFDDVETPVIANRGRDPSLDGSKDTGELFCVGTISRNALEGGKSASMAICLLAGACFLSQNIFRDDLELDDIVYEGIRLHHQLDYNHRDLEVMWNHAAFTQKLGGMRRGVPYLGKATVRDRFSFRPALDHALDEMKSKRLSELAVMVRQFDETLLCLLYEDGFFLFNSKGETHRGTDGDIAKNVYMRRFRTIKGLACGLHHVFLPPGYPDNISAEFQAHPFSSKSTPARERQEATRPLDNTMKQSPPGDARAAAPPRQLPAPQEGGNVVAVGTMSQYAMEGGRSAGATICLLSAEHLLGREELSQETLDLNQLVRDGVRVHRSLGVENASVEALWKHPVLAETVKNLKHGKQYNGTIEGEKPFMPSLIGASDFMVDENVNDDRVAVSVTRAGETVLCLLHNNSWYMFDSHGQVHETNKRAYVKKFSCIDALQAELLSRFPPQQFDQTMSIQSDRFNKLESYPIVLVSQVVAGREAEETRRQNGLKSVTTDPRSYSHSSPTDAPVPEHQDGFGRGSRPSSARQTREEALAEYGVKEEGDKLKDDFLDKDQEKVLTVSQLDRTLADACRHNESPNLEKKKKTNKKEKKKGLKDQTPPPEEKAPVAIVLPTVDTNGEARPGNPSRLDTKEELCPPTCQKPPPTDIDGDVLMQDAEDFSKEISMTDAEDIANRLGLQLDQLQENEQKFRTEPRTAREASGFLEERASGRMPGLNRAMSEGSASFASHNSCTEDNENIATSARLLSHKLTPQAQSIFRMETLNEELNGGMRGIVDRSSGTAEPSGDDFDQKSAGGLKGAPDKRNVPAGIVDMDHNPMYTVSRGTHNHDTAEPSKRGFDQKPARAPKAAPEKRNPPPGIVDMDHNPMYTGSRGTYNHDTAEPSMRGFDQKPARAPKAAPEKRNPPPGIDLGLCVPLCDVSQHVRSDKAKDNQGKMRCMVVCCGEGLMDNDVNRCACCGNIACSFCLDFVVRDSMKEIPGWHHACFDCVTKYIERNLRGSLQQSKEQTTKHFMTLINRASKAQDCIVRHEIYEAYEDQLNMLKKCIDSLKQGSRDQSISQASGVDSAKLDECQDVLSVIEHKMNRSLTPAQEVQKKILLNTLAFRKIASERVYEEVYAGKLDALRHEYNLLRGA